LKKLFYLLVPLAGVVAWGIWHRNDPPSVRFAKVRRETLISSLPTNGKAEPYQWQAVRVSIGGVVSSVAVQEGQAVKSGAPLAELTDVSLNDLIQSDEARVSEARANLSGAENGGKPAELASIENDIARLRVELGQAQRDYESLSRLAAKQAATPVEAQAAQTKVQELQVQIDGLVKRRAALMDQNDVAAAKARLEDAEATLDAARKKATLVTLRAPLSGLIYGLAVRAGSYLSPGDLVANVGQVDRLRVRVYVDEPELGRVSVGQPVTITWDGLPGKSWQGKVEKMPAAIQTVGTRQVGEVICVIENPGRELIPGTNVNAEIRTAVAENALVIPKEALRRDADGAYVLLLNNGTVERRAVKTGISSVTEVQIIAGLSEEDAIALPATGSLKPGDRVQAVM
jgi:HlyD family secretion protein